MKNILSRLKKIGEPSLQRLEQVSTAGIPLGQKLFLFLTVLVLTIILGVVAILLGTGTFTAGLSESERIIENELSDALNKISESYGQLSLQTVCFSKNLSGSIEREAGKLDLSLSELHLYPHLLEEIISSEYVQTLFTLQLAKCSGVFFILDATINPALAHAENSRAGLYIKNMEPNVLSASSPNIILLRGFPGLGLKKSLPLHAQWKMEFDISNAPYYHVPMAAAIANPLLPRSRLYFWSDALKLPGTSEEAMLCAAPLIDSNGCVFGVCGLEISAMLFKLSHIPNNSNYRRLFCVLTPLKEKHIELHRSLLAGGYSAKMISNKNETLRFSKDHRYFYTYTQKSNFTFLGLHAPVQLYPRDSAFADRQWAVAVMVPKEDIMHTVTRLNVILFSSLTLLVILGLISSYALSQRLFIKPISDGLDMIRSTALEGAPKTKIPEIDDLIDYLVLHNRELAEKAKRENLSIAILNEFLERTRELSPAEREVFELYGEGYTAREIAAKLYLSINTIKTHSKHIYSKLEVTSREELYLYIQLLKETGREIN